MTEALAGAGTSLVLLAAVVVLLWGALGRALTEICGKEARAKLWQRLAVAALAIGAMLLGCIGWLFAREGEGFPKDLVWVAVTRWSLFGLGAGLALIGAGVLRQHREKPPRTPTGRR